MLFYFRTAHFHRPPALGITDRFHLLYVISTRLSMEARASFSRFDFDFMVFLN